MLPISFCGRGPQETLRALEGLGVEARIVHRASSYRPHDVCAVEVEQLDAILPQLREMGLVVRARSVASIERGEPFPLPEGEWKEAGKDSCFARFVSFPRGVKLCLQLNGLGWWYSNYSWSDGPVGRFTGVETFDLGDQSG